MHRLIV